MLLLLTLFSSLYSTLLNMFSPLISERQELERRKLMRKAVKTVRQMLEDRGYVIANDENEDETVTSFGCPYKIFAVHKEYSDDYVVAYFLQQEVIGIRDIKECALELEKGKIDRGIIIYRHNITAFAQHVIEKIRPVCCIELFTLMELQYNITKHKLVPKHELLGEDFKEKLVKKYHLVSSKQLPKIQVTDPVSRYFGAMEGEVFKITRISETAGKYITYRVVI